MTAFFPTKTIIRGRIPGPLGAGITQTTVGSIPLGAGGSTPARLTRLEEPNPVFEHSREQIVLTHYSWSIFYSEFGYQEVRQGFVANCPLPAFIAAMAHTKKFATFVRISEINQPCQSTYNGSDKDTRKRDKIYNPNNYGTDKDICKSRFFRVQFPKNADGVITDISDFFWSSLSGGLVYAKSSKNALWVSVLEKAFVQLFCGAQGYERLSDANKAPTANEVVEKITGTVQVTSVDSHSNDQHLQHILRRADKMPTIVRRKGPTADIAHALTVLGFDGSVHLFNPLRGNEDAKSYKDFKKEFDFILSPTL